jgi:probable rRNA maturation factor
MAVLVENRQNKVELDKDIISLFEKVVDTAMTDEHFPYDYEVSIILVDNEVIRALNSEYRDMDCPTDVLSFAMMEGEEYVDMNEDGEVLLGDIVISIEKAVEQAEEYGHPLKREIAFLTIHGVLHLLGYDHESDDERLRMRAREEDVLCRLGLARG